MKERQPRKRNQLCECGSGKQYKRCCRAYDITVRPNLIRRAQEIRRELTNRAAHWRKNYGRVREFITDVDPQGFRYIAVGGSVITAPSPNMWATPPEFLSDYVGYVIDPKWGNEELDKPPEAKHILAVWRESLLQEIEDTGEERDGYIVTKPSGVASAYLCFAYDLYLIGHNSSIQPAVIQRLKQHKQFQGAYFELVVAAIFLRAGFELAYEDETDSQRRHHEFQALHRETGAVISVEAKSRHRAGVLKWHDANQSDPFRKLGIRNILRDALGKPTKYPSVVFIDLNFPTISERDWEDVWKPRLHRELECELGRDDVVMPNVLFFTNISHHYGDIDGAGFRYFAYYIKMKSPKYSLDVKSYLPDILSGIRTYGAIPPTFEG
jgi:hypothetical protein